ncbi:hypothetical protein N7509_000237 [Penicillium cosmopolitanum]|uniref:Uncharacterized protein n=1 Tax=Penicillium cosmopolitanum TaxID=1131564 RepID=A0A9W9WA14_9EURO|nr:uncharacterized protein N7509_000237 [Penicillium cosmopolitanum]KAJ5413610.1 hypothetical protein N7509_000237 [Penicillium cosmopolitanum]
MSPLLSIVNATFVTCSGKQFLRFRTRTYRVDHGLFLLFQQHLHIQIQDDVGNGQFYNEQRIQMSDNLTSDDVDDMIIRHNGGIRMVCSMYGSQGRIDPC